MFPAGGKLPRVATLAGAVQKLEALRNSCGGTLSYVIGMQQGFLLQRMLVKLRPARGSLARQLMSVGMLDCM